MSMPSGAATRLTKRVDRGSVTFSRSTVSTAELREESRLRYIQLLFKIEDDDASCKAVGRPRIRQRESRGVAAAVHRWLLGQRLQVPDGSATTKAIDDSLKRWEALTRYIGGGDLPISNNRVENQIRPIALGRSNGLLVGSLRAGKRAAAVMSLVHSSRINGHDP